MAFKRGNRVRYVGNAVPARTGRLGTVKSTKRGWIMVHFDGDTIGPVECAECNLKSEASRFPTHMAYGFNPKSSAK